jgi:hypothetical protein
MTNSWRAPALGVAITLMLGVGGASAQTVFVRHAPAGAAVELFMNLTAAGSATADAAGDATIKADLQARLGKEETDAYMHVDVCKGRVLVHLVERGVQPPAQEEGCTREQVGGLFWLRRVTTMVVNLTAPVPTMRLRQGSAPREWLSDQPEGAAAARTPTPAGLVLFGGGGFTTFSNVEVSACGDVVCESDDTGLGFTAGVAFWFTPFLAAEASYLKPATATAESIQSSYRFTSELKADVLTVAGVLGAPLGAVRIYGKGGPTYHRASALTMQTIEDRTVTIDGVEQTIPGGTQSYGLRTGGWGWMVGGGLEGWLNRNVAIYTEVGRAVIKGETLDAGEGALDDAVIYLVGGVRARLGR